MAPSSRSLASLLVLYVSILCSHYTLAIPSVPLASFSLSDVAENGGDTVLELVTALESKGIIAIRGIPEYAAFRQKFLRVATKCVASSNVAAAGVQSKTLRDGTTRRTISSTSLLHAPSEAQTAVEAHCPGYAAHLRAFSELLNVVALRLARAIDTTLKSSPSHVKGDSLERIVASAHHLDHFHSYSSPTSAGKPAAAGEVEDEHQEEAVLSVDLHTDNGVMILMTAPEFYSLQGGGSPTRVPRKAIQSGPQASAGLLIKQPRQHHVVQPVLEDDELIVMVGEGYKAWMYSTLDFKAVLHGMQMPQFSPTYGQISRSWFGKMILLPKHHPMKNLGITFEEYTEKATKYVMRHKGTEGFSAVACPPHSNLVASDKTCALQLFEPLADSRASRQECMSMCNTHAGEECQALCQYVATIPSGGVDCWMLCLPNGGCASGEVTTCDPNGKQQTVCVPAKTG